VSAPEHPPAAPALPATYSTLSAEALLDEVRRAYAIDGLDGCHLLQRGLNDTYVVAGAGRRWVARVYGSGWRSAASIAYELDLLGHLDARGVRVALPIPGRDQGLARPVAAPEGTRQLVLFAYLEGSPLQWEDPARCEAAGRAVATLHAAADDFASRHPRVPLDLEYLVDAQLAALRPFVGHRPEWRDLTRIGAALRARVSVLAPGLEWGACHGDLAAGNLHAGDDGGISFLDFDLAAPGWRAYDLAAVHWVATSQRHEEIWGTFVRGYADVRAPGGADLEAVPLFHAIRRLWSLGMEARNAHALGSYRLGPEYLAPQLNALRQEEHAGRARRVAP
jgi:Ser/Thr protein kinase RdoA (MazF antagonist)